MTAFNTGDVVTYVGKSTIWDKDRIHVIHEVDYLGKGCFQYSTNKGAWFKSQDFKLVRKADKESLAKLDKDIEDEYEEV